MNPLLLCLALSSPSLAGTTIEAGNVALGQVSVTSDDSGKRVAIDWVEVDGSKATALACSLERMPLLGAMVLGPAVGVGARAAQACQKSGGAAARVSWTWGEATTGVVVTGVDAAAADCVAKAMATMPAPLAGTCQATILLGERTAAEAAAATLAP